MHFRFDDVQIADRFTRSAHSRNSDELPLFTCQFELVSVWFSFFLVIELFFIYVREALAPNQAKSEAAVKSATKRNEAMRQSFAEQAIKRGKGAE